MGIVTRQGSKNLLWFNIGLLLGYLNIGYLMPRYLTPEEFGITRTIIVLGQMVSVFSQMGLGGSIIRFMPYFRGRYAGPFMFFVATVCGGLFLLFSLLVVLLEDPLSARFADGSPMVKQYFLYLVPMGFALFTYDMASHYARATFQAVVPVFLKEVLQRILVLLLISAFALQWLHFRTFFWFYIGCHLIPTVALFIFLRHKGLQFTPSVKFFRPRYRKLLLNYAGFRFLNNINNLMANRVDVLMIGLLLNQEKVGLYALGSFIAQVVQIGHKSLQPILNPLVAQTVRKRDYRHLRSMTGQSSMMFLLSGGIIFTLVWGNIESLMVLFNPRYRKALEVIFYLGLTQLVFGHWKVYLPIIAHSKHYRSTYIMNLIQVGLLVGLDYTLIPTLGITGAAIGTLGARLVAVTMVLGFVWRQFKMHPFSWRYFAAIGLVTGMTLLASALPVAKPFYVDIVYRSSIVIVLYISAIVLLGLSPELVDMLNKGLKPLGLHIPNAKKQETI